MGLILAWMTISLVSLAAMIWWSRSPAGMRRVWLVSLILTVAAFGFRIPMLFVQYLVTFCLASACLGLGAKPTLAQFGSILATAAIFSVMLQPGLADLREVQQLRREFPLESLSGRLAYERQQELASGDSRLVSYPSLSTAVERRLDQSEFKHSLQVRPRFLRELHDKTRDQIVMARGFGKLRIRHVRRHYLTARPYRPLAQPTMIASRPSYNPLTGSADLIFEDDDENDPILPPTRHQLLSMHFSGTGDFLNPERMGYIKDVEHVAGFQSHGYTRVPELRGGCHRPRPEWSVARLELISLLRHPVPVAYQSENLPQMDELKHAKTRPLTDFERDAIDQLRTDEDIVIRDDECEIQLVGSLRATNECLKCHTAMRGELLGALTYRLVPSSQTVEEEDEDEDLDEQDVLDAKVR